MPWASLRLAPGVDVEKTPSLNEAGISSSSFIRWKEGLPEKRGGWAVYVNTTFSGVPRCLHAWEDINTNLHLAIGTTQDLYVVTNGNVQEITAQATTVSITVNVDTTSASNVVVIHDTGRNATIYDSVVFNTPISVGGIVLSGTYPVYQAAGPDAYQILAASNATGTVTGGGAVPQFTTTSGSPAVTVTLNNHGYSAGQYFPVKIATTVGGVTLSGQYLIVSTPTANTFVINAANAATSSTSAYMNGGNASLTYYITLGPQIVGSGYGIGGYGSGGYGTGVSGSATTGTNITATDYWLENWGEILVSCPTGGPIFTWSPESGYFNSQLVSTAPPANAGMFIAMPSQQIMCWGSTYTTVMDPLQIRWSDAGNYAVWTPTTANQAGGYHLPTGSQIVGGLQGPSNIMFWTDIDLYLGTYIGAPLIWGFNKVSGGCGLIAPKAMAIIGQGVFWMSQKQFFVFNGGTVAPIPCRVWDAVFQNLNLAYIANIRCGTNAQFNEVVWYFPSSASTGENDTYVSFNIVSSEWDIGPLNRSAWIDQSVLGSPIGADSSGNVYQHEVSPDAAGNPIAASFTTGYFAMAEGEELTFVDWFHPDMKWGYYAGAQTASVQITFNVVDYVGDTPRTYGPYTVTQNTPYVTTRFRGRFASFTISSNDIGSFWRLGRPRYRFAPDGRR